MISFFCKLARRNFANLLCPFGINTNYNRSSNVVFFIMNYQICLGYFLTGNSLKIDIIKVGFLTFGEKTTKLLNINFIRNSI